MITLLNSTMESFAILLSGTSYRIGYEIGAFIGRFGLFLLAAIAIYLIFIFVKRKKSKPPY